MLSQAENDEYFDGYGVDNISTTNLEGGYKFWDETGTVGTETDVSGNGNDLTGVNSCPYAVDPFMMLPTNTSATNGDYDGRVDVTWDTVTSADSYNVYRSLTSGSGFVEVASSLTTLAYTDTSVTNEVTYWYAITAENSTYETAQGTADSGYGSTSVAPPDLERVLRYNSLITTQVNAVSNIVLTQTVNSLITTALTLGSSIE